MSKYAFFIKNYSVDDSQPWLTDDLVNEIHQRGNEVTVFFFDLSGKNIKGQTKRANDFVIYTYPLKNVSSSTGVKKKIHLIKGFLGMYIYFLPKVLKNKFDNVISFSMFTIFFGLNILIRIRNRKHVKSTAILWDFYPVHMIEVGKINNKIIGRLLYKLENFELTHFDDICCMTNKSVEFFDRYHNNLSHKHKKVIYLWRKLNSDATQIIESKVHNFKKDQVYLTFGGQLSKGRGLEFLLDIATKYQKELTGTEFIIIGEGALMPLLKERVKEEGLSNFHLLGRVKREEYLSILSKSHVGLVITQGGVSIPSFPSKTIDYMLMKLPILACVEESTDYGDIIENKIECGLSSKTDDDLDFVKNLNQLVSNAELRKQMGENGSSFLHQHMSVSNIVDLLQET